MKEDTRWSPFRELERLRDEMDRMFDEFFTPRSGRARTGGGQRARALPSTRRDMTFTPSMDLYEVENYLMLKAELPGVKKENIRITVEENRLKITAETSRDEDVKDENYYRAERSYGTFSREIELPATVKAEQVEASYEDGVLTLRLPKTKSEHPKEITIK